MAKEKKIAYIINDAENGILYISDNAELEAAKNVWKMYYDKNRKMMITECSIDGIYGEWVFVPSSVTPVIV